MKHHIRRRALAGVIALTSATVLIGCSSSEGPSASEDAAAIKDDAPPVGSPVEGTIWVANEEGGSLSAIDVATSRVVATVDGVDGPHNVQAMTSMPMIWATSSSSGGSRRWKSSARKPQARVQHTSW